MSLLNTISVKLNFSKKLLITALFFSAVNLVTSQVVINEYSASNLTSFTDNFGNTEDFIELYNTSATPVNLTGYKLSDKISNLGKWTFGNVNINGNSFLRIWASGRNITTGPNLNTSFNLNPKL